MHPKNRRERLEINSKHQYKRKTKMDSLPSTVVTTISAGNVQDLMFVAIEDFLRRSKIVQESDDVIELNLEPLFDLPRDHQLNLKYTIQKIKEVD